MHEPDSLDRVLDVRPLGEDRYALEISPDWLQGRGAFGGLVVGAMLRAIARAEPEAARAVRSVTAEIPAPVLPGGAVIEVLALRRGAKVSTLRATMLQGDEVVAQLVAVLGAPRPSPERWSALPPPDARWRDTPAMPFIPGVTPDFARAFEYRSASPPPFSGAEPRVEGWVRARAPCEVRDAAWVAALADAFWPTVLVSSHGPRATATIAFTLQVVHLPTTDDEPLCYRATTPVLDDGYLVEFRELWTTSGQLVALNQQTFVIIR